MVSLLTKDRGQKMVSLLTEDRRWSVYCLKKEQTTWLWVDYIAVAVFSWSVDGQ